MGGSQRFCTRCGHELRPGGRFCPACGHPVAQEGHPAALPDEKQMPAPANELTAPQPIAAGMEPIGPPPVTVEAQPTAAQPAAGWPAAAQPAAEWPAAGWPDDADFAPPPAVRYPPAADDGSPGGRNGRRSRWLLALAVVVLVAAGGTAAALFFTHSSRNGEAAANRSETTTNGDISTAPTPIGTPRPSPSPAPAAPAQVSVDGVTVDISAVNTDPNAAAVASSIGTYFGGIDSRNYLQAWNTFAPELQAKIPYQPWSSSLSTTRDTRVVLQNIRHDPNGDIDATVSFRSHQAPQNGPNPGETCTNWSLVYRLAPAPAGSAPQPYLISKVKKVGAGHTACGPAQ